MHALRWITFALILFGVAAILPSRSESNGPVLTESNGAVSIVGTMTAEGVECPAMRGDDGKLYTLAMAGVMGGGSGLVSSGFSGRVRVEGTIAEISNCQQGITISVTKIEPAE